MSFNKFIARLVKTARDQVVKIEDLAEKQITNVANTGVDFVKNSVPFDIPIELDADELIEGKSYSSWKNSTWENTTKTITREIKIR